MPTTRISTDAHKVLLDLANKEGESMQKIVEKALEAYRRQLFLEESNRAFAALRANAEAWEEEKEERALWDTALADGLEEDCI